MLDSKLIMPPYFVAPKYILSFILESVRSEKINYDKTLFDC